jgi:gamma-glutamyltranspeptidase / glutathione hydrolase
MKFKVPAILESKTGFRFLIQVCSAFLAIAGLFALSTASVAQVGWPKGYDNGIVVSANQASSQVGVDIMKRGGNAVDAAIAVKFALAVTFPAAGNIGGGGFMVVREADGRSSTLDFRERAPAAATEKMYQDLDGEVIPDLSLLGHLASGVPGTVDGMIKAYERFGSLDWAILVEPAVSLARDGFVLGWKEADGLNRNKDRFGRFAGSQKSFTRSDGRPWMEGDTLRQPDLAATLERIRDHKRDGFYAGETARLLVEEMKRGGGIITNVDLESYASVWRDPIRVKFKDYELITMPPPSSGGVAVAQMLGMLQDYDIEAMGFNSAESIHLITETMRRVYADRAEHLGDPDFVDVPVSQILDKNYLNKRMSTFNPKAATPSSELSHGNPYPNESEETTHFSVVDANGMAVSLTTTLNGGFGSYVTVEGAGFLLNNEMDDFSAKPGVPNMFGLPGGSANKIEPGKRMLSSMTPTIVEQNGELRMVLGTPGGATIITTVLQTFLNMAVFGMDVQQAVSAPRFHHQWLPDRLQVEPYMLSLDTHRILESFGHSIAVRNGYSGRADCIFVDTNGRRWGGNDPRGEDATSGY